MGKGTFGIVLGCWDVRTKRECAVKVVRRVEKYREAAMIEIDILEKIRCAPTFGIQQSPPFFFILHLFPFLTTKKCSADV